MDIIYINNINDGIYYSPLIEKNIKSNYKYYSKYHLENVINKNILLLEEILIKRQKQFNIIKIDDQQPFPYIKSEIGMNFKQQYKYSSIKDIETKKKFLYDHTINQIQLQRGQIEPRVFLFSISIEQELQYNKLLSNDLKKDYIKEIIIQQIIQQMKFHLIVRKYYQNIIQQ